MWFRKSYVPMPSKTHRNIKVTQVDLIKSGYCHGLFQRQTAAGARSVNSVISNGSWKIQLVVYVLPIESLVKRSQVLIKSHGFAGSLFSDDYFFWNLVCQTRGVRGSRMPCKVLWFLYQQSVCIYVIHTKMTFGVPHAFLCCWGHKNKPTGGIFVLLFST